MREIEEIKSIVESLLFAAEEPVTLRKLTDIIEDADNTLVQKAIEQLRQEYDTQGRAFQIEEVAGGYHFYTKPEYYEWISRLRKRTGETRLSQAALETLSIIAYKQPVIRATVESIRGVQSGQIIKVLMERDLVKVVGRDASLGHPLLYGTTKKFLEYFGLKDIKDLPKLEELEAP
ncbi:MAG: SMC-Scp complex subunit ScpB [Candidatus Loosdrechtia sp.]|uniref:SMC-Scp complex subunit ScpB n=1 Tax=Candidatus Loosdrechtia sp. TaxID=3101272 RepID=UPI003A61D8B8|nr:MAG: SMC-Scp complex subunit ScpB [Candidatus Jettenia sp. AMX2]